MDTAAAISDQELEHLEALRRHLLARGFLARVVQPLDSPAHVHVVNTNIAELADDVRFGRHRGEPWFLWSWGLPIAPVRFLDAAADRVAHVLRPRTKS
jgi:hypothetical protein